MPSIITLVVVAVVAIAVGVAAGFFLGQSYRRKTAEAKIGSAEEEAMRIVNDAIKAAEQLKLRQMEKLETIAGLTQEDAKHLLLNRLDQELTHEKAMRISAYESNLKDECDTMAREMIGQAIARCAADHSSETTVSVVPLPNDEMKGRIIGREGRNIRALETATGVDLILSLIHI